MVIWGEKGIGKTTLLLQWKGFCQSNEWQTYFCTFHKDGPFHCALGDAMIEGALRGQSFTASSLTWNKKWGSEFKSSFPTSSQKNLFIWDQWEVLPPEERKNFYQWRKSLFKEEGRFVFLVTGSKLPEIKKLVKDGVENPIFYKIKGIPKKSFMQWMQTILPGKKGKTFISHLESLWRRTKGNPFYWQEALKFSFERGWLFFQNTWELKEDFLQLSFEQLGSSLWSQLEKISFRKKAQKILYIFYKEPGLSTQEGKEIWKEDISLPLAELEKKGFLYQEKDFHQGYKLQSPLLGEILEEKLSNPLKEEAFLAMGRAKSIFPPWKQLYYLYQSRRWNRVLEIIKEEPFHKWSSTPIELQIKVFQTLNRKFPSEPYLLVCLSMIHFSLGQWNQFHTCLESLFSCYSHLKKEEIYALFQLCLKSHNLKKIEKYFLKKNHPCLLPLKMQYFWIKGETEKISSLFQAAIKELSLESYEYLESF
ncbi:MAG: hypothetical protein D6785_09725, partial [Planctomycetota bacterium]